VASKIPESLVFEVTVDWDKSTGGEATIANFPKLKMDLSSDFGGLERYYSPDDLFLAALGGCLLNTFNFLRKKMRFELIDFRISLQMYVKLGRSKFRVTRIEGKVDITVPKGEKKKGETCFELTEEYCHLCNFIKKTVPVELTVEVKEA